MQDFFHVKTSGYTSVARGISFGAGIVLALPALLSIAGLILGYRQITEPDFWIIRAAIPVGCGALWLILSFAVYAAASGRVHLHSRYTYLEIQPSLIIFSKYTGSWSLFGRKTVMRRLYVIPFKDNEISFIKGKIVFKGKIRRYDGDSERLGYHVKRGEIHFDNWWLDENGYDEIPCFTLPDVFARPGFICHSCKAAQNRYKRLCELKKKQRAAELEALRTRASARTVRRKPKKRIYTEIPTYNRSW